jgi:hypothetical protein
MFLAQKNPSPAYASFNSYSGSRRGSTNPSRQYASTKTDSTAHIYEEHDPGYIRLDFNPALIDENAVEDENASFAALQMEQQIGHFYEPQTPFNRKTSVLKPLQMFGATQPSVGYHLTSLTSRQLPDTYNDFGSPSKRQRIASSEVGNTSPLQSSVHHMLARSMSTELPLAIIPQTSSDAAPRIRRAAIEPRPYLSMKESQERRSRRMENEYSDSSDSSINARRRRRKMKREKLIRQELSTVWLIPPSSGRPASATSTASAASAFVQVPSTVPQRSWQEEYSAQCEGFDARDAQQSDIVADSQANLDPDEISEPPASKPPTSVIKVNPGSTLPLRDQPVHPRDSQGLLPLHKQSEHHSEPQEATNASQATISTSTEPSLPLQELSTNRRNMPTPMVNENRFFSHGSEPAPETIPLEESRRPIGEITSIPFGRDIDNDMANIFGFTQDIEYDNAVRKRSFSQTPARATVIRNDTVPPSEAVAARPSTLTLDPFPFSWFENLNSKDSEDSKPLKETAKAGDIQHPDHLEPMVANEPPPPIGDAENGTPSKISEGNLYIRRSGLRSKNDPKGLPRAPSRSGSTPRRNTPSLRVSQQRSAVKASGLRSARRSSVLSSTISTLVGTLLTHANTYSSTKSSGGKSGVPNKATTAAFPQGKCISKCKLTAVTLDDNKPGSVKRSSNRHSTDRATKDTLNLPGPSTAQLPRPTTLRGLFENMAFAVSYIKRLQEKDDVTKLILDNGGQILQDGFEVLFEKSRPQETDTRLTLSATAKPLGFSALIADDHSRRAKYIQALALGLPCISGHWVLACIAKGTVLDWSPYLLCAGQSSFLGNAIKSRTLEPYPATEATLKTTLQARAKLLNGKSVLVVMGKGKTKDKRKAYVFLTRAIGADRVRQVVDLSEARKELISEGQTWDLLYVDSQEEAAEAAIISATNSSGSSRKRKRRPMATTDTTALPKRIRVINDERMIQSLILGQLLED